MPKFVEDVQVLLASQKFSTSRKRNTICWIITTLLVLAFLVAIVFVTVEIAKSRFWKNSQNYNADRQQAVADMVSSMDLSADPCVDFYQYSCGGWLESTRIPPDQNSFSRSFGVISELNRGRLREILESKLPLLSSYYEACMDEDAIEERGLLPLQPYLTMLQSITTREDVGRATAVLESIGVMAFFSIAVSPDSKHPEVYAVEFRQGGLGMPKDKYLDDQEANMRSMYKLHIATMLQLSGIDEHAANEAADDAMDLELYLAKNTLPGSLLRDPYQTYNAYSIQQLQETYPSFPFEDFLKGMGVKTPNSSVTFVVDSPQFMSAVDNIFAVKNISAIRNFLTWHLVHVMSGYLTTSLVNASFDFYSRTLFGQEDLAERWKRCVASTDSTLGELLGRYYVEKHFSSQAKAGSSELIASIEKAFHDSLLRLDWLDEPTREAALNKLQAINNKVGYPANWTDYSSLQLSNTDFFGNYVRAKQFDTSMVWNRLGQPIYKGLWQLTPPSVNAYYDPSLNEMVFPAGIIQPPFYSPQYPMAINFGAIGMVMGHELTHGFDDTGRKYDGTGKLTPWWTANVANAFNDRTACVFRLYSNFSLPQGRVNPLMTMGENIADMGGVKYAFLAYKSWIAEHGAEEKVIPFLTNEQLFFVAFAQDWCQVKRPEFEEIMLRRDPHAPGKFRVIGPLMSLDAFSNTFKCPSNTPMNPIDKCVVW